MRIQNDCQAYVSDDIVQVERACLLISVFMFSIKFLLMFLHSGLLYILYSYTVALQHSTTHLLQLETF